MPSKKTPLESAQSYANTMREPIVLYRCAGRTDVFHMTLATWNQRSREHFEQVGETILPGSKR